jgi:hypothetical protein
MIGNERLHSDSWLKGLPLNHLGGRGVEGVRRGTYNLREKVKMVIGERVMMKGIPVAEEINKLIPVHQDGECRYCK